MFIERVIHIDTIVSGLPYGEINKLLRRFAPRNDGHCERSEAPCLSRRQPIQFFGLPIIVALVLFVNTAYPQAVPYITDVVGEDGAVVSADDADDAVNGALRLIGVFKLFNPDTVPFHLWVSFENGGRLTHYRAGQTLQTVRLVDMELRYKNDRQQPVVKKFPSNRRESRAKKRFGASWFAGGGRSGKRGSRGGPAEASAEVEDVDADGVGAAAGGRGRGVYEIVFWKEDAQAYYEMELWGVLYSPDVRGAVVAGSYVENIKFEIESAR